MIPGVWGLDIGCEERILLLQDFGRTHKNVDNACTVLARAIYTIEQLYL
jgi:hypothetical protein